MEIPKDIVKEVKRIKTELDECLDLIEQINKEYKKKKSQKGVLNHLKSFIYNYIRVNKRTVKSSLQSHFEVTERLI